MGVEFDNKDYIPNDGMNDLVINLNLDDFDINNINVAEANINIKLNDTPK